MDSTQKLARGAAGGAAILIALALATPDLARADRLILKTVTGLSFVNPEDVNAEYRAINDYISSTDANGYAIPEIKNLLNQMLYAGYELDPRVDLGVLFTVPLISTVSANGQHPSTGNVTTEIRSPHLNLALGGHYHFLRRKQLQVYLHPFAGVTFWRSTSDANVPFSGPNGYQMVNLRVTTRARTFFGGATLGALYHLNETFRVNLEAGYHHWQNDGAVVKESNDPAQRVGNVQSFTLSSTEDAGTDLRGFIVGIGLSAAFDVGFGGGAPSTSTSTSVSLAP